MHLEKEQNKLKAYLGNSKKILLVNHRRMDGDAYGSLAGFYYLLEKIGGYQVKAINDELTPKMFDFIKKEEIFEPNLDIKLYKPDIIICFDIASKEQFGDVYKNNLETFLSTTVINIDHHSSNTLFGNINIVDQEASSTCEIVFDLIKKFELENYIDENISSLLLMGIITDTNSFFNTNSSAKSMSVAAELMNYKPKHQEIIINLFKKKSYSKIKLWGKILETLKDIKDGKIVWNIIPRSLFIQTGTTDKDISGFIDEFLMSIDGLELGFLLYELEDKKIKGSFRSKTGSIDLDDFCKIFGGGGHSRASGFVVEGKNLYEVEQQVITELQKKF